MPLIGYYMAKQLHFIKRLKLSKTSAEADIFMEKSIKY